jgi:hypothetical protein
LGLAPDASFSIYGERGVVDIVAWHAASRSLLIIELKTLLVDPQELVATMDRRVRLGGQIACETWLADPGGRISALSFLQDDHAVIDRRIATRGRRSPRA